VRVSAVGAVGERVLGIAALGRVVAAVFTSCSPGAWFWAVEPPAGGAPVNSNRRPYQAYGMESKSQKAGLAFAGRWMIQVYPWVFGSAYSDSVVQTGFYFVTARTSSSRRSVARLFPSIVHSSRGTPNSLVI